MGDIYRISSLSLPEDFETFRHPPARTRVCAPQFWEGYDRTTLVYDAVYIAENRILRLYCPNPVNLAPMLLRGSYSIDGVGARPLRVRRYGQFWALDFHADQAPKVVGLRYGRYTFKAPVNIADTRAFSGRNCLYTMVRDGDLDWVQDWALYHHRAHRADAAIVVNNGSSDFSSADIIRVLRSAGLGMVRVVEAPLRYGPVSGASRGLGRSKFLQVAMMNLVRDTLLPYARAVLTVDTDELVVSERDESIFDHAVRSKAGYVTITGRWRHTDGQQSAPRHVLHRFRDPEEEACEPKYCLVPGSLLGRRVWGVHRLAGLHRTLFRSKNFHFLHCREISTSWKFARRFDPRRSVLPDTRAADVLDRFLSAPVAPSVKAVRADAA